MKLPRDLRGDDLSKVLTKHFGYRRLHQQGSHLILETDRPRSHRLSIPNHDFLRIGTLSAILRAVANVQEIEVAEILRYL